MAKTKTKSGSKVKVNCPNCGKEMTQAGLIGHMAWKHGTQSKAPLLPSTARPRREERLKAGYWDRFVAALDKLPAHNAPRTPEAILADIRQIAAKGAEDIRRITDSFKLS